MYKAFQLPRHSCRNIYQTQYTLLCARLIDEIKAYSRPI